MTIHQPIPAPRATVSVSDQFNRLRGRLVGLYAKLEQASADAIITLDPEGKVPLTLKPRLTRIRELLAARVPEAGAEKITACIDQLDEHLSRRNIIVHAGGAVLNGSEGQWRWVWRMAFPEQRGWWTEAELSAFEKDFHSRTDRLCTHLSGLKKRAVTK